MLPSAAVVVVTPQPANRASIEGISTSAQSLLKLPNHEGSLKFLVLGDFGTGTPQQYELAAQMAKFIASFHTKIVITVGDNIFGRQGPQDFKKKFEEPYKELLDAGVKFYASLGNHDSREQTRYAPFNMNGRTYYSFKAPQQDVKFLAIESDYLTPKQIEWLQHELDERGSWVIPYFHHPPYSSGKQHGSDKALRKVLEPMFLKGDVTVVFTGHDHFYERTNMQHGITYFVVGSGGALRPGNLHRKSALTSVGFDRDLTFLAVEIEKDQLFFSAVSRTGEVVDSGVIQRRHQ